MNVNGVASIFETIMVVCFGLSWPMSIVRSYKARTAKGKSIFFMVFIVIGYIAGIIAKTMTHGYNLAYWFYYINVIMVSTDICLYFRNRAIDKKNEVKK
jgi:hypothetical protein